MSNNVQNPPADSQNDEFIFAQEDDDPRLTETAKSEQPEERWKILIVDDEAEVHEVTRLSLSDLTFENKPLTFISAYSMREAKQLIQAHPDTAIIFLDVVMETENAGLELIPYVREELGNLPVRIILRTGQPGQAPERVVITNYGIDDYQTKTELTSEKLLMIVVTALRAFSTMMRLQEMSQALKQELMQYQSVEAALEPDGGQLQEKADGLGRSLPGSHPNQPQSEQREKLETLGRLLTAVTHDLMDAPNAGSLYTMHLITRIARMMLRITDEQSAKLGLSQSKLAVLMYLSGEPERSASPSSLAEHCGISRAAMTGLLNGLEQENYVERDSHPFDRRALTVKLTPKGQQFLGWIEPQDKTQMITLMDILGDGERQKLIELAREVFKLLGER